MAPVTVQHVIAALGAPRPGLAAQLRLSPEPRPGALPPPPPVHPTKEAGVLILLYFKNQELYFPLTRRTDIVAMHKGQISLPGGAREGSEQLVETACRETTEELGINGSSIEILGPPLTPLFIPVSDFWVTAYVGHTADPPDFEPAPVEVHELIETPLAALLDERTIVEEEWNIRGMPVRVPFFNIQGHKVWGATAMMLAEFASMLTQQIPFQET